MKEPIVSIDRRAKSFAVFDGFDCVRPFEKYVDEAAALKTGTEWVKERTPLEPKIVYPVIKKIVYKS